MLIKVGRVHAKTGVRNSKEEQAYLADSMHHEIFDKLRDVACYENKSLIISPVHTDYVDRDDDIGIMELSMLVEELPYRNTHPAMMKRIIECFPKVQYVPAGSFYAACIHPISVRPTSAIKAMDLDASYTETIVYLEEVRDDDGRYAGMMGICPVCKKIYIMNRK
jgi:hypothetical protein